jgi:hypothetical protein
LAKVRFSPALRIEVGADAASSAKPAVLSSSTRQPERSRWARNSAIFGAWCSAVADSGIVVLPNAQSPDDLVGSTSGVVLDRCWPSISARTEACRSGSAAIADGVMNTAPHAKATVNRASLRDMCPPKGFGGCCRGAAVADDSRGPGCPSRPPTREGDQL